MRRALAGLLAVLWLAPVGASGLLAGGFAHRVWVDGAGLVWTQGDNLRGQLGNGGINRRDTPQHPLGMDQAIMVASGLDHVLVLRRDGTLWGWGYGDVGQVGATFRTPQILDSLGLPLLSSYTIEHQPVQLALPPIATIAAGSRHSLAVAQDGVLYAWGANDSGQLGLGDRFDRYLPARLSPAPPGIVQLTAGYDHSLALDGQGTLYAWGANDSGQLGDGTQLQRTTPGVVWGLPPAQAMAAGAGFTVLVDRSGQLYTWGANGSGQLGDGTTMTRLQPMAIPGAVDGMAVAAGRAHALGLRRDGTVWAWGANESGQLGLGDTQSRLVPEQVLGLPAITAIACGDGFSLAQGSDGVLYAWGNNAFMQLGPIQDTGSLWLRPRPTQPGMLQVQSQKQSPEPEQEQREQP